MAARKTTIRAVMNKNSKRKKITKTLQDYIGSDRQVFLTGHYDFNPEGWGRICFTHEGSLAKFQEDSDSGAILAVYMTSNSGHKDARKVIGVYELTHKYSALKDTVSPSVQQEMKRNDFYPGQWQHCLLSSRAWSIVEEDRQDVDKLFNKTYHGGRQAQSICVHGKKVENSEAKKLLKLRVEEREVYSETKLNKQIEKIESSKENKNLSPSRAISPASEPYLVGESDGPKYLHILELKGDIAHYLGRDKNTLNNKIIIKVGFSGNLRKRVKTLQSAYPAKGIYKWNIIYPKPHSNYSLYPNANIAIIGEDAMKAFFNKEAESLGGEFFLTEKKLCESAWKIGNKKVRSKRRA